VVGFEGCVVGMEDSHGHVGDTHAVAHPSHSDPYAREDDDGNSYGEDDNQACHDAGILGGHVMLFGRDGCVRMVVFG